MFELISSGVGLVIFLSTMLFPLAAGFVGKAKGYSFWLCALLGLFLQFVGLIIVLVLPESRKRAY